MTTDNGPYAATSRSDRVVAAWPNDRGGAWPDTGMAQRMTLFVSEAEGGRRQVRMPSGTRMWTPALVARAANGEVDPDAFAAVVVLGAPFGGEGGHDSHAATSRASFV
jgi:hypothetical protein